MFLKLGASGYVTKPFTEESLLSEIEDVLSGKDAEDKE